MIINKENLIVIICIIVLLVIIGGMAALKIIQAYKPQSLVTTFKGDPKTTRAFTWYSDDPQASTIIQLKKAREADGWEGDDVLTFEGITSTIAIGNNRMKGVHKVEATGLEPGVTYSYRAGDGKDRGWSDTAVFLTEPEREHTFTFLNVTDSQGIKEHDFALWGNTLKRAIATFPDARFIVHNGDFTEYADDEQAWSYLYSKARQLVTRIPLMPVTGNHDEVEGEAERFVSHFNVPHNGAEGSIAGTTYYYDYGSVRFIMLNSESNIKGQTKWLRENLKQNSKPWIIVSMHRGPYGGNSYKKIEEWVEVFDEFGVDLVLQGHNHEYSRSYPLRNNKVVGNGDDIVHNREGTVYVVTNTAGQKFNEKNKQQFYHQVHFQNGKQMFAGITVSGDTLTYQAYDIDGVLMDEFQLVH